MWNIKTQSSSATTHLAAGLSAWWLCPGETPPEDWSAVIGHRITVEWSPQLGEGGIKIPQPHVEPEHAVPAWDGMGTCPILF